MQSNIPVEREVKVLEIKKDDLIKQLKNKGAKKTFEGWIHDVYFDYPNNKLYVNGVRIRLRNKHNEKIIFSFKDTGKIKAQKNFFSSLLKKYLSFAWKKDDKLDLKNFKQKLSKLKREVLSNLLDIDVGKVKEAKEIEFDLPSYKSGEYILNALGLKPVAQKRKHRISYALLTDKGKVVFDFDKYDGIPWLVEIEAPSDEVIYQRIKKLGLEKNPIKSFGSRGLFRYYGKPYHYL